jgi:hypothetical protein
VQLKRRLTRIGRELTRTSPAQRLLYGLALALFAYGIHWGLPGNESWAPDAVSPRGVGLLAIAETFRQGHFHIYPPLHMALLTVMTAPITLVTLLKVGFTNAIAHPELFEQAQTKRWAMTGIELVARIVSLAMALGLLRNVALLFGGHLRGKRARDLHALFAIPLVLSVAPLSYYAKVGNLDVPALFWASAALVSLRHERLVQFTAYAAIATLTKDQAIGLLLLPFVGYALVSSRVHGPAFWRGRLSDVKAAATFGAGVFGYVLVSGALVNPTGFVARIQLLFGPASRSWSPYPRTASGTQALLLDVARELGAASSYGLMLVATLSALLVIFGFLPQRTELGGKTAERKRRLRVCIPFLAATSFFLAFTLGARRTEARFLLPIAVFLAPYASCVFVDTRLSIQKHLLGPRGLALGLLLLPGIVKNVSVGATMSADARYVIEAKLKELPTGATLTAIGGPKFLPRFPGHLHTTIPSTDPNGTPPYLDHAARSTKPLPETDSRYILLSAEFAHLPVGDANVPYGVKEYADPASQKFLRSLTLDELPYRRIAVVECRLTWPLECVKIHGSLGEGLWLFERVPQ